MLQSIPPPLQKNNYPSPLLVRKKKLHAKEKKEEIDDRYAETKNKNRSHSHSRQQPSLSCSGTCSPQIPSIVSSQWAMSAGVNPGRSQNVFGEQPRDFLTSPLVPFYTGNFAMIRTIREQTLQTEETPQAEGGGLYRLNGSLFVLQRGKYIAVEKNANDAKYYLKAPDGLNRYRFQVSFLGDDKVSFTDTSRDTKSSSVPMIADLVAKNQSQRPAWWSFAADVNVRKAYEDHLFVEHPPATYSKPTQWVETTDPYYPEHIIRQKGSVMIYGSQDAYATEEEKLEALDLAVAQWDVMANMKDPTTGEYTATAKMAQRLETHTQPTFIFPFDPNLSSPGVLNMDDDLMSPPVLIYDPQSQQSLTDFVDERMTPTPSEQLSNPLEWEPIQLDEGSYELAQAIEDHKLQPQDIPVAQGEHGLYTLNNALYVLHRGEYIGVEQNASDSNYYLKTSDANSQYRFQVSFVGGGRVSIIDTQEAKASIVVPAISDLTEKNQNGRPIWWSSLWQRNSGALYREHAYIEQVPAAYSKPTEWVKTTDPHDPSYLVYQKGSVMLYASKATYPTEEKQREALELAATHWDAVANMKDPATGEYTVAAQRAQDLETHNRPTFIWAEDNKIEFPSVQDPDGDIHSPPILYYDPYQSVTQQLGETGVNAEYGSFSPIYWLAHELSHIWQFFNNNWVHSYDEEREIDAVRVTNQLRAINSQNDPDIVTRLFYSYPNYQVGVAEQEHYK